MTDNSIAGVTPADGYTGNITPEGCWQLLANDAAAVLIDVRTRAEWAFVGQPDLSSLGKQTQLVEWVQFPDMSPNDAFADQVEQALDGLGVKAAETPLLFLCRSGQRSQGAARTLFEKGYVNSFNVLFGFEGDKDGESHRGTTNGWKVSGLPWQQG